MKRKSSIPTMEEYTGIFVIIPYAIIMFLLLHIGTYQTINPTASFMDMLVGGFQHMISEPLKFNATESTMWAMGIFTVAYGISSFLMMNHSDKKTKPKPIDITAGTLTVYQFMQQRRAGQLTEFEGCYILHNTELDKYYVGQSINVIKRVHDHFTGYGCPDVYADHRFGCPFTIRIIKLQGSGFSDLNSMEKFYIAQYDSYNNGYNKTQGNG